MFIGQLYNATHIKGSYFSRRRKLLGGEETSALEKTYTLPQKLLYNSAALPNTSGAEFVVQVLPLWLQTAFTTMAGGKNSSFIAQDATKNIRNSQQCLSNISEPTISVVIIRQLRSSVLIIKPSMFVLRKVCGVGGRERKIIFHT